MTTSKNMRQNPKPFLERFFLAHFENGIKNHSIFADDWENCIWSEAIKTAKNVKNCFFKCIFLPLPKTWDKIQNHFWKDYSPYIFLKWYRKPFYMGIPEKNWAQKIVFFNAFCYHFQKRETKSIFGKIFPCTFKMVLKTILNGQMTEKIASEVSL